MRLVLWMLLIAIATRAILYDVFMLRRAIATSPLRDSCVCFVVGATLADISDVSLISSHLANTDNWQNAVDGGFYALSAANVGEGAVEGKESCCFHG